MNSRLIRRTLAAAASTVPLLAICPAAGASPRNGDPPRASERAAADELLVGFEQGASAADRARVADKVRAVDREAVVRRGGKAAVDLFELRRGASEASAIKVLERDSAVAYAEPNWRLTKLATSTDPCFVSSSNCVGGGSLWGMKGSYGSGASEAWAAGFTGSSSVAVGVIDEGIWFGHRDLDGNVWTNPADPVNGVNDDGNGSTDQTTQYTDDVHGWDFYNDDNTVYDGNPVNYSVDEHGTHVTGTIAAEGNNGTDATQDKVVGVNWDVDYVSGKFLGPDGGYTDDAVRAVDYMTDLKSRGAANIVATNNSWGGGGYSATLHDAIIRGAKAGILFVAAAGNSYSNNDKKASYPSNYRTDVVTSSNRESAASYDAVIAVTAITSSGSKPSWAQYGKTTVDLGAPGSSINSTVTVDTGGTAYWSMSGTSMATPHVTGALALYKSRYPTAPAATIKAKLLEAAKETYTSSLSGRVVTNGRLNIGRMLAKQP
jgi:subtilisin family serine protease